MAKPARTEDEITLLIHNSDVGATQGAFELISKTIMVIIGPRVYWQAEIQRNTGPQDRRGIWVCYCSTQSDGTQGKTYYVIDDEGNFWDWDGTDWVVKASKT